MKHGNLSQSPALCKSFIMPYFHVLSYAFSRSKNIAYILEGGMCDCQQVSRFSGDSAYVLLIVIVRSLQDSSEACDLHVTVVNK